MGLEPRKVAALVRSAGVTMTPTTPSPRTLSRPLCTHLRGQPGWKRYSHHFWRWGDCLSSPQAGGSRLGSAEPEGEWAGPFHCPNFPRICSLGPSEPLLEKAHVGQSGHLERKGEDDKPVGPFKASPPARGIGMKIEWWQERGLVSWREKHADY